MLQKGENNFAVEKLVWLSIQAENTFIVWMKCDQVHWGKQEWRDAFDQK